MCVSLKEKPRNSIFFDGECSDCKIDGHLEQNTWGKCAFYKAEILIAFCHEFVAWTTDRYHNVRDKPEICKMYILKPHIFHCLTLPFANRSIVLVICGFRDGTVVFSTGFCLRFSKLFLYENMSTVGYVRGCMDQVRQLRQTQTFGSGFIPVGYTVLSRSERQIVYGFLWNICLFNLYNTSSNGPFKAITIISDN